MCMQLQGIRPCQHWNWNGDIILRETMVPAGRRVSGRQVKGHGIDIRQFVSSDENSAMHKALDEISHRWTSQDQQLLYARDASRSDFRADRIFKWFTNLQHIKSHRHVDHWLFPEETLAQSGGDSEDLSFLLGTLLIEAGISSSHVRIALGRVIDHTKKHPQPHDHVWVMYQRESGVWQILDPLTMVKHTSEYHLNSIEANVSDSELRDARMHSSVQDVEYIPYFVFNSEQVWRVSSTESTAGASLHNYLNTRQFATTFNPAFAVDVHNYIYEQALTGMSDLDLLRVKNASLYIDINVLSYDPRDHCDFAYIQESWDRMLSRLASGNLEDFGLAVHAIGDLYAHSMHAYFASRTSANRIALYDPANPIPSRKLVYDFTGLSLPGHDPQLDAEGCAQLWQGKLISGQWWRDYATYPDDLKDPAELQMHRNLPDHDCLAVDSPASGNNENYFVKNGLYEEQFLLRRQAAIDHVAQVYQLWLRGEVPVYRRKTNTSYFTSLLLGGPN